MAHLPYVQACVVLFTVNFLNLEDLEIKKDHSIGVVFFLNMVAMTRLELVTPAL